MKFVIILLILILPIYAHAGSTFVGVAKCKLCHKSKKRGQQYQVWQGNMHAQAYKTLENDKSKEVAQKANIEGDPQKAKSCLECHVTAFGTDLKLIGPKFKIEDGVQCEACHGPGSDYAKMSIMKNREKAKAKGLIISDEQICLQCHNEKSPTFKEFDFKKGIEKIAHPKPTK